MGSNVARFNFREIAVHLRSLIASFHDVRIAPHDQKLASDCPNPANTNPDIRFLGVFELCFRKWWSTDL